MPYKSKMPFRHPGCPELVEAEQKYCEKHKGLHPEEVQYASARGYGSRWQKARKRYLQAHPLCEECKKSSRYVEAPDVDHIVPHRGDPKLFWDQSNWQALCNSCYSKKTGKQDMHSLYEYK